MVVNWEWLLDVYGILGLQPLCRQILRSGAISFINLKLVGCAGSDRLLFMHQVMRLTNKCQNGLSKVGLSKDGCSVMNDGLIKFYWLPKVSCLKVLNDV